MSFTPQTLFLLLAVDGLVGAVIGYKSAPHRPGAEDHLLSMGRIVNMGHWTMGLVLVTLFSLVTLLLSSAAMCVNRTSVQIVDLSGCSDEVARWYIVTQDWQSAIGAGVGLLGLAWATHLKAAAEVK
jgi:hypothetical protein